MAHPVSDYLTAQDIRDAVKQFEKMCDAPPVQRYAVVDPRNTWAHVFLVGRWRAFKLLLETWEYRTDFERMDGLRWIVQGVGF